MRPMEDPCQHLRPHDEHSGTKSGQGSFFKRTLKEYSCIGRSLHPQYTSQSSAAFLVRDLVLELIRKKRLFLLWNVARKEQKV